MTRRWIIHVDMDAFYAAVEQRDRPELRGKPVIVGGLGPRGVVSAASYEARAYGVHSALPMARARRLCRDGIYLRPDMARYREASQAIFGVFEGYTPLVEGLSLDEAFLDVTGSLELYGGIESIGRGIVDAIAERTGLSASVGMAPSKFLAKIASDIEKPRGFVRVPHGTETAFLDPLPLRRLWGAGQRTTERLGAAGLACIGDVRRAPASNLIALLGRGSAEHLQALARGEDDRPVVPDRPAKSLSAEETFDTDVTDAAHLQRTLLSFSDKVGERLRRHGLLAGGVQLKVRSPDFTTHTRRRVLEPPASATAALYDTGLKLLRRWLGEHAGTPVRLLGLGAIGLTDAAQPDLFAGAVAEVDKTVDAVRERFGDSALVRGRLVKRGP